MPKTIINYLHGCCNDFWIDRRAQCSVSALFQRTLFLYNLVFIVSVRGNRCAAILKMLVPDFRRSIHTMPWNISLFKHRAFLVHWKAILWFMLCSLCTPNGNAKYIAHYFLRICFSEYLYKILVRQTDKKLVLEIHAKAFENWAFKLYTQSETEIVHKNLYQSHLGIWNDTTNMIRYDMRHSNDLKKYIEKIMW